MSDSSVFRHWRFTILKLSAVDTGAICFVTWRSLAGLRNGICVDPSSLRLLQEAQLSQRGRAMLRVGLHFANSLKITQRVSNVQSHGSNAETAECHGFVFIRCQRPWYSGWQPYCCTQPILFLPRATVNGDQVR